MSSKESTGFWSTVYDGWLLFAELVGNLNSKIIVGILYFLLVPVVGLLARFSGHKLLDRAFRIEDPSAWRNRQKSEPSKVQDALRHQFIL